ncbi:MAG: hypothetical protein Tsb0033_28880 [Winogradskyella sp.]
MKSVIETLEKKILSLKAERRVWNKPPNFNQDLVDEIDVEIKEHKIALNILCSEKTEQSEVNNT